jgi:hypothetical protein
MSAPESERDSAQRRSNLRLGLFLGLLAFVFFAGIIVEQALGR